MAAPVATHKGALGAKNAGNPTAAIGFSTAGSKALIVCVSILSGSITVAADVSLSDSKGNTYTQVQSAGPANQVIGIIFECDNATALATTDTFTFTIGASGGLINAHEIEVYELDVASVTSAAVTGSATGSSTSPAVTSGAPASADWLWIGTHAIKRVNTVTDTITSTGYTLQPTSTAVQGTSGGSATSNASQKNGNKGVTGSTATQTWNGTLSTSSDWAAVIQAFKTTAAGTNLSPASLDHSRALGTGPKVNPSLVPASLTRTRALGGPVVSPKLGPAGLSRTRALGTITVSVQTTLSPAGLAHTRALGSTTVNPKLAPAGLSHTRAIGTTKVVVLLEPAGLVHSRALGTSKILLTLKPLGLSRTRSIAPAPKVNTTIPMIGLVHSRALGATTVGTVAGPGGLTRTRALGAPQLNPKLVVASLVHSRTLGAPTAQSANQIVVSGLAHSRALGSTTVSPRVLPAGLTRTRALGSPVLGLGPAALTHTRALGAAPHINVTIYIASAYGGGPYGGGPYGVGSGGLDHNRSLGQAGITGITAGSIYDQGRSPYPYFT